MYPLIAMKLFCSRLCSFRLSADQLMQKTASFILRQTGKNEFMSGPFHAVLNSRKVGPYFALAAFLLGEGIISETRCKAR